MAAQFLVLQLAVIAAVLLVVSVASVHQSTNEFRAIRGQRLSAAAENLVATPVVRDGIDDPARSWVLAPEVDRAAALSGARTAEIIAPDGTVIASTDPRRVGTVTGFGPSDVLAGRGWSGDLDVSGQRSIAAHVPVLRPTGEVVAVAAVSEAYPSRLSLLRGASGLLVLYLGLGAAFGLVGSWLLARRIKRHTRGLEVDEIASLADHREALLHSIREGVVAVTDDGVITLANDGARHLLALTSDALGRTVDEVPLEPAVREFLRAGPMETDVVLVTAERVLVLNRRPASSQGKSIGSVTTMRDSTEVADLQNRLSSHKGVTDTLRAQTHEFANQLHTISGLAELEEYAAVKDFVAVLTRRRAAISDAVTSRIDDPAVAALLIAKVSLAAESLVTLELTEDSALPHLDPALSADVITVLGNLVDNALDACVGGPDARVLVHIEDDEEEGIVIEVEDTGPGVPEELRSRLFTRGVTSKAADLSGRGIGLALVRIVAHRHGGTAEVVDRSSGGARFRVRLPGHGPDRAAVVRSRS
ncbi:ATP-binding protein [Nocardiopsis tropica]|uniref:sensor histidine kinase n=1 Tax=Tsukamurella strandjordii TaxID=147577 RepID=UPI0031CF4F89